MARSVPAPKASATTVARLSAFVLERFPFAVALVRQAFEAAGGERQAFRRELERRIDALPIAGLADTTPGVSAAARIDAARAELAEACEAFLERADIAASLAADERREILRGMILTRAVDNRLKQFFTSGEVRYGGSAFQGKGFRSLGQEAIYAAGIRLRRGVRYSDPARGWQGDVVGPIIRDLGIALAMRPEPATVRMVLNAQMGKQGPPMNGKDLHIGDFEWGILPATAPLSISTLSVAGLAMAFARDGGGRVAFSFIGEGGSSLGEWHEAINLCAARKLPAVFSVENNHTALSTPVRDQSAVRVFADKAAGYGIPGITIDGTDPDAIAAAFTWAADRARAGEGPALIELVCMRMCGHAHHDDMLYLGREPALSWEYPEIAPQGAYADRDRYKEWAAKDPIATYANTLEREGVIAPGDVELFKNEAQALVDTEARAIVDSEWPEPGAAAIGVFAGEPPRIRVEPLEPSERLHVDLDPALPALDRGLPFDRNGRTFLEAVMLGVGDALRADPRVFVYGEDVGGEYGNAFLLLRPLLKEFADRIINSPIAEAGVLGVCVGAALAGQRPIGEMQFNDFVASGFNQLVNNAAKIRYRWGGSVPMVVRMPWGGLRHAGPYHSQNTEPWFYRTPGLKIVVPSTPQDARALMAAAVRGPGSGALLRAHRPLSRSAHQAIAAAGDARPPSAREGGAASRRRRPRHHLVWRLRPRRDARRGEAGGGRDRGRGARPAHPRPARQAGTAGRGSSLQQGTDRPRGLADRRHRRKPGGHHPGRGVRVARRAGANRRRARHPGAVFTAARGVLPAVRTGDRTRRPPAGRLLKLPRV